jgi:hypothetical protein
MKNQPRTGQRIQKADEVWPMIKEHKHKIPLSQMWQMCNLGALSSSLRGLCVCVCVCVA